MNNQEQYFEISGWFESEYGAEMVMCHSAADDEDLAAILLETYGDDCLGVDMELEGTYPSGKEVDILEVFRFLELISEE